MSVKSKSEEHQEKDDGPEGRERAAWLRPLGKPRMQYLVLERTRQMTQAGQLQTPLPGSPQGPLHGSPELFTGEAAPSVSYVFHSSSSISPIRPQTN